MSSQDRPVEPAETPSEGDNDGNTRAHDREKEKDAGVGITAREQKGPEQERAEQEHPTHNWSLRVRPAAHRTPSWASPGSPESSPRSRPTARRTARCAPRPPAS